MARKYYSGTYYINECCVCGQTAHYRVGKEGFCSRHKSFAYRARAVAQLEYELMSARAEKDLRDRDRMLRMAEANRKSRGTKNRGVK